MTTTAALDTVTTRAAELRSALRLLLRPDFNIKAAGEFALQADRQLADIEAAAHQLRALLTTTP